MEELAVVEHEGQPFWVSGEAGANQIDRLKTGGSKTVVHGD